MSTPARRTSRRPWLWPPLALAVVSIATAAVRRDRLGIALILTVPLVFLILLTLFKRYLPKSWFATGDEATAVVERWKRVPILGPILRSGGWWNEQVWGFPRNWPIGERTAQERTPEHSAPEQPDSAKPSSP